MTYTPDQAEAAIIEVIARHPGIPRRDLRERLELQALHDSRAPVAAALARLAHEGFIESYRIASNVARRNMSTGARAMATALVLVAAGRREGGKWSHRTFGKVGESPDFSSTFQRAVRDCGIVLDWTPDSADEVIRGLVTLDAAYKAADAIRTSEWTAYALRGKAPF